MVCSTSSGTASKYSIIISSSKFHCLAGWLFTTVYISDVISHESIEIVASKVFSLNRYSFTTIWVSQGVRCCLPFLKYD